ncbi:APH domain-containing protein [Mycena kentingensis (nom. inval.)]|nr:APH domain-containing protein [Mycena kentingensis (nom. inval.)]
MAMLHPDDEAFAQQDVLSDESIRGLFTDRIGLLPTQITCPERQGAFHKVYFVSLPDGREVVLRVARKTIVKFKTENEVAILQRLANSGIPVPSVVFYSSDPDNALGYEYDCLERISYPSLQDVWMSLFPAQLDGIVDQLVDIFLQLWEVDVPRVYGCLAIDGGPGPVLEETMWQTPDIIRYFHSTPYNLISESFESLNPTRSYPSWPAYISAFLKTYHHIISIHPSVAFLHPLLLPLQRLIDALDTESLPWIARLRTSPSLYPRLFHKDFHFGNILLSADGTIKGIIDWEFAGLGPSFGSRSSLIQNCVGYLRYSYPENAAAKRLVETWPGEFQARLERRAPEIAATWARETDRDAVLGLEGNALSDIREYLRACLEVGVRGVGRVSLAKSTWMEVVEKNLRTLGFMDD